MTPSPGADEIASIEFLREAARYFAKRDTHGEDRAFWANVMNAENCNKAADRISRLLTLLREANERIKSTESLLAEASAAMKHQRERIQQLERTIEEMKI